MLSKVCDRRVKSIKGIRQQRILEEEGSPRRRRQSSKKKAVLEVGVVKLCLEERTIC
jgi:hypothetical protein